MEPSGKIRTDLNLSCKVCGEKNFYLKDGFYYCNECGTKDDQVRAVVIEDDDFNENGKNKMGKKHKILAVKSEEPQLTSWECYNYILRGLVEELISMGAKDELKLMALQVWAAYLRRTEIAFFSKKHIALPKLGVNFLKRDLKILYNHSTERKNKKRTRSNNSSLQSGESDQRRVFRQNKRKLDESQYSIQSASITDKSGDSGTLYSNNSSSTGTTTGAVQLKFSAHARKHYKKMMPIKHLKSHEKDFEGLLKCHKMRPVKKNIPRFDFAATSLNLKQIYSVLAIALNLVEDEIQLCDLVRFIQEERISKNTVSQYFPDNIALHCKELLKDILFNLNPTVCSYKSLREQTSILAKFLHINEFKKPDINKLALRYITELRLPDDVAIYVERLIKLLPPQMRMRGTSNYPAYEARAMAYIIFVLKLIFGLDGHKEILISNASRLINIKINDAVGHQQKKLFIWSDWMEYIEMRKVIIAQFSPYFGREFDQCQDPAKLLEDISEEFQRQQEDDITKAGHKEHTNMRIESMKRMFEQLHQNYGNSNSQKAKNILLSPSFTPAHSYFKRILLHVSTTNKFTVVIPEFMRVDHTQRSIKDYLQPKPLNAFLKKQGEDIKIQKVACTTNRTFVGIFRTPSDGTTIKNTVEADFDICDQDWLKQIKKEPKMEELEFKTTFDSYHTKHVQFMRRKGRNKNAAEFKEPLDKLTNNSKKIKEEIYDNYDILSLHSIDVFKEDNMEPIENLNLSSPRRRFDGVEILNDVSGDEVSEPESEVDYESENESHQLKDQKTNKLNFLISNLDYWILNGYMTMLTEVQKKVLERQFPCSFFWLLQTCAQTIGIDWSVLYQELLVIEVMFVYGIESLDEFKECIKFISINIVKDINQTVHMLREIW